MRYLLLLNLFIFSLFSQEIDSNTSQKSAKLIIVEDKSGLSDDELRKIAKNSDKKDKRQIHLKDVYEATDSNGTVDMTQITSKWEDLSPTPLKYDWIQSKTGEWFKGEIKALYDDKLEFDSDEVDLYTFKFKDVTQIKSYHIINVNIENLASFSGILRLKNNKLTIIQGDHTFEFDKKDIVSFAPDGELERNFWSGKLSLSFDIRTGNTIQKDFSSTINLKRRTSSSRLEFDYLGRISSKDNDEISNDHRLNEKFDVYLSRNFFWTPLFSEFYTDKYKNINKQITAGIGIGYTPINTKTTEWSISGGPAFVYTRYYTTTDKLSLEVFSPALEISTKVEIEISKTTDFTYDYKLSYTDKKSGTYKHHMLVKLENELLSWLDIDITGVWDYIYNPTEAENGNIPYKNDFQLLLGFGIEF